MAIAGYEYRIDGGSWVDIGLPVGPLTTTVAGLNPLTTYGFEMRWYDEGGNRHEISNEAFATTLGLPAMRQWLTPEALIASGYGSGGRITTWVDASTYKTDATGNYSGGGYVSAGPTFQPLQLNGFPVAGFEQVWVHGLFNVFGQWFDLNIGNGAWSAQEFAIVIKSNAESGVLAGSWDFRGTGSEAGYDYPPGTINENFGSTTNYNFASGIDLKQWHIYQAYSAANDWKVFIDGVEKHSSVSNTVVPRAARLGQSNIDSTPLSNAPFLKGYVAEYIFWINKLTTPQRATVLGYLQDKFNL